MANSEIEIRNILNTSISGLTTNTNLFAGPERDDVERSIFPNECVFVQCYDAIHDEYIDGATQSLCTDSVQVLIRSEPKDYAGARLLADSITDTLAKVSAPTGYIGVILINRRAQFLTIDERERYKFVLNVRVLYNG